MIVELVLVALVVGCASGGRFWRLADVRIRYWWLMAVSVGMYLASRVFVYILPQGSTSWFFSPSHIVEKLAFIALAVANLRLPGVKLVVVGMVSNLTAIVANGGLMPARAEAIAAVFGRAFLVHAQTLTHARKSIMGASTKLPYLCDIIPLRRPFVLMPGIFSVGDVVLTLGICIAIIAIMRNKTDAVQSGPLSPGGRGLG